MSNYLIDAMTWSHSRIGTYIQCPYQFYMKYICGMDGAPMFFASYGSFIHRLMAGYYSGRLLKTEAETEYLLGYSHETVGIAPSADIRISYFEQGRQAISSLSSISGHVLGVEQFVQFDVDGRPFIGFVDLVYKSEDGALVIMDHKSTALKPRGKRKKPTQSDLQLDAYLRQLYLYSMPIRAQYGRYPDFLEFNCYRNGMRIKEQFQIDALNETKEWALETIESIKHESNWSPKIEFWQCKYLCGFYEQCEYAQLALQ